MVQKILDLHVHSKYSRACSKDLTLPNIAKACEVRGIDIVATGDFTHPGWLSHIKDNLIEDTPGIFKLRTPPPPAGGVPPTAGNDERRTKFILGTEVSSIKKHAGQTRRVHHLIFAPSLEVVEKFNAALTAQGCNLKADGRPILGLTSKNLLSLMLEIDERMVLIPAHVWTPWFGIFGSKGGYDSLEECFEELTPRVRAIETGLSSDPLMNWRWSKIDNITLISNSDAHSAAKLGREANVLQFVNDAEITYDEIMRIIQTGDKAQGKAEAFGAGKFLYTIEFYPEEGKYHLDGHRDCQFVCTPEETKRHDGICPKCKRPLTIGVMNRVNELADRTEEAARAVSRISYRSLVPLPEIIADVLQVGVASKAVGALYAKFISQLGNEFHILLKSTVPELATVDPTVAEAILRVRQGKMAITPGYDGVFGIVKIFTDAVRPGKPAQTSLNIE